MGVLDIIRTKTETCQYKNGECSRCSKCCDRVLPLARYEVNALRDLLNEDSNLREEILRVNNGEPHLLCPFLDPNKRRCLIYDKLQRPMICKMYSCNETEQKNNEEALRFWKSLCKGINDFPEPIDMWELFNPDEANDAFKT